MLLIPGSFITCFIHHVYTAVLAFYKPNIYDHLSFVVKMYAAICNHLTTITSIWDSSVWDSKPETFKLKTAIIC